MYSVKSQILIANYTTQTTFYKEKLPYDLSLKEWLDHWISETTEKDLEEMEMYKNAKRQHIKYREGDFFAFKIGRTKELRTGQLNGKTFIYHGLSENS